MLPPGFTRQAAVSCHTRPCGRDRFPQLIPFPWSTNGVGESEQTIVTWGSATATSRAARRRPGDPYCHLTAWATFTQAWMMGNTQQTCGYTTLATSEAYLPPMPGS